jgi:hypothetical protein
VQQVRGSVLAALVDRGGPRGRRVYSLDIRVAAVGQQAKTVGRLEPPRESAQCAGSRGTRIN